MNNLQINQPSFKGAFLIDYKNTKPVLRRTFEETIARKGRQILPDFEGKFDQTLYIMKNSKDYDTAHFIKENNLKFKYIPDIDTKMQFDSEEPEKVSQYISENKPFVINKLDKLMDFISENRTINRARKNSELSYSQKIIKLLGVDMPDVKQKRNDGSKFIINKNTGDALLISPSNKYGSHYVIYTPKDEKKDVIRLAIDKDNNILAKFSSPAEIVRFKQLYIKAVKEHSQLK